MVGSPPFKPNFCHYNYTLALDLTNVFYPVHSPPPASKYPHAGAVDHIWVSRVWCYDLGLPQLSETLFINLVDGRVLDLLTRDELKRHLKITTKVHQVFKERGVDGCERRGEEEGEGREGGGGKGKEGREGEGRGGEERGGEGRWRKYTNALHTGMTELCACVCASCVS